MNKYFFSKMKKGTIVALINLRPFNCFKVLLSNGDVAIFKQKIKWIKK